MLATPSPAPESSAPAEEVHAALRRRERQGLWFGLAGVLMFAITIPMTRLAVGPADDPQLPPAFVAVGRATVAGMLSIAYLLWTRAPWPARHNRGLLLGSAVGAVFGFPLFLGFAVRHVDAAHAAVVTGLMPLATAVVAAVWLRQRPSIGFWACAALGCALVTGYALLRSGGRVSAGDMLLLAAIASAAVSYVGGARLAGRGMTAEQVICWMVVACLPLTLPLTAALAASHIDAIAAARPSAWLGFGYVSLVSMWLGFFAWYRGLALGGTMRVSQVQLIQPFAAMLAAVPLLGERLDAMTIGFAIAVIATVAVGKRMPVS